MTRHLSSLAFMENFSSKLEMALNNLSMAQFPPNARRTMRKFTSTEVATLLGVTEAYIRQVAAKEQGPEPEIANGRASTRSSRFLNCVWPCGKRPEEMDESPPDRQ